MNNMGCALDKEECDKTKMDIGIEMLLGSLKFISIFVAPGASTLISVVSVGIGLY